MPFVNADVLRERFPTPALLVLFVREQMALEAPLVEAAQDRGDQYLVASEIMNALDIDVPAASDRFEASDVGTERIWSKDAFFGRCAQRLAGSKSIKLSIVGPTFLEPEWWQERSGDTSVATNFSLALRRRLFAGDLRCEVVLRNVRERYALNLAEYVDSDEEWEALLDGMLVDAYSLFGSKGQAGPRVRCFDPGYAHIPHLFDDCALITTRRNGMARVDGGWEIRDPQMLNVEGEKWSSMFDSTGQEQSAAVLQLRTFLESLRGSFPT